MPLFRSSDAAKGHQTREIALIFGSDTDHRLRRLHVLHGHGAKDREDFHSSWLSRHRPTRAVPCEAMRLQKSSPRD